MCNRVTHTFVYLQTSTDLSITFYSTPEHSAAERSSRFFRMVVDLRGTQ